MLDYLALKVRETPGVDDSARVLLDGLAHELDNAVMSSVTAVRDLAASLRAHTPLLVQCLRLNEEQPAEPTLEELEAKVKALREAAKAEKAKTASGK